MLREFQVALVVSRHGHDGAGSVADQHIVGNPDRDLFSGYGIDGIPAGKDAALFAASGDAILFAGLGDALPVRIDLFPMFVGGQSIHQGMLRSQHHIGGAEQRIRPRRINPDCIGPGVFGKS